MEGRDYETVSKGESTNVTGITPKNVHFRKARKRSKNPVNPDKKKVVAGLRPSEQRKLNIAFVCTMNPYVMLLGYFSYRNAAANISQTAAEASLGTMKQVLQFLIAIFKEHRRHVIPVYQ